MDPVTANGGIERRERESCGDCLYRADVDPKLRGSLLPPYRSKQIPLATPTSTLLADEWNGEGPRRIGLWLLLLAIVVPVLYLFWPPPTAADRVRLVEAQNAQAAAEAVRQERQQAVTANTAALSQAIDDWNKAQADLGAQQS